MFKLVVLSALVAVALAAPAPGHLAVHAPVAYTAHVAPAVSVPTAMSHQSRTDFHHKGVAVHTTYTAPAVVAAPVAAVHTAYAAPVVAAPAVYTAYSAPAVHTAYSAPAVHTAYSAPIVAASHGVIPTHGVSAYTSGVHGVVASQGVAAYTAGVHGVVGAPAVAAAYTADVHTFVAAQPVFHHY